MFGRIALGGAGALALAAMLALGVAATRWGTAEALTNCSTGTQGLNSGEQQLMTLINTHRAANGRAPLAASPNLSRAAAWMSEDMSASGVFSHVDSLGRAPFSRVIDCGYGGNGAGENIARYGGASTTTAQGAFDLFVNSTSGHNENMLNSAWHVIGVGQTGPYWVVDFGVFNDSGQPWDGGGAPPPPPPPATTPAGGGNPPSTPFPTQAASGGNEPAGPGAASDPALAPKTVLPAPDRPAWSLPANVPVKRAYMASVAFE